MEEQREIYSQKIRAGKRTYIFDVRATKGNDYYITITERKRRLDGSGFQKQKLFLYKEDFNKFLRCLSETIDYVKVELLPNYDFERYNNRDDDDYDDDWNDNDNDD
ncbi:MAG: DUF3276 family protein [Bacteroidia bacterium]|nr:PUR family DNA/RNA-binding protein [Bacteroidia bacterium]MDW8158892.1 DUF3276 family protein [Bacteroidia bacterium]